MKRKYTLLAAVLISRAFAQQGDYGDYGGSGNYGDYGDDNRYQDYSYGNQNDNLYADYAARQQEKAVGSFVGWPKMLASAVGGYIAGAMIHSKKKSSSKMPKLRFKVGQRVMCNMSDGWKMGTIVKLWGKQGEGVWAPYQVKLDDGRMTFAPMDAQGTIRAAK